MALIQGNERATLAQAALYFADEKTEAAGAFNLAVRVEVRGRIAAADLAAACRRLVAATPALQVRMGIDTWTGEIVYGFSDEGPEIELLAEPVDEAEAFIAARTMRPFEVDGGPLVRFLVLPVAPAHTVVVLIVHHLIYDWISHRLLAERLSGSITGGPAAPDSPDSPDSPDEYVRLVRRVRAAEESALAEDRDYWYDRIPPSAMVVPFPREGASDTVMRRIITADPTATAGIGACAGSAGVSVFKLVSAAVHHALPVPDSGVTVLGGAASQRLGAESAIVGCFINEVPLSASRKAGETVVDLVRREHPGWSADLRRRHYSFAELAAHVRRGGGAVEALNQVMISYRRQQQSVEHAGAGVTCTAELDVPNFAAKTPLSVRFFEDGARLGCEVQWSGHLSARSGERYTDRLAESLAQCAGTAVRIEETS
ncbi:condensation domain-containing protein [Kitasatospora sp. NPDC101155]|uniref:condensation domain-containing protein n=1 Tax=Kitasatospora sp. NPDC101155 TaxID=3364097 RepID=UPI003804BFE3